MSLRAGQMAWHIRDPPDTVLIYWPVTDIICRYSGLYKNILVWLDYHRGSQFLPGGGFGICVCVVSHVSYSISGASSFFGK